MWRNYWKDLWNAVRTLSGGLKLTFRHVIQARETHSKTSVADKNYFAVQDGLMTVQYPHESLPVPDNGRYKLHNEIDDCIVCDKCAKVCPVDCIEIESIRAAEEFGKTSDGTPKKIYAARFDIDMGKCCFCGLCTTVCPTECLTMTKTYDFSEYDVADHVYEFATMTPLEILEKQKEWDEFQASKPPQQKGDQTAPNRPVPKIPRPEQKSGDEEAGFEKKTRPVFRPKPMVPKKKKNDGDE